ncbi:hypothetical protein DY000_02007628 [Brassica cretica]|uniref:Uncharacterized protein n=1 Tax=Brassica cretica TaxID=69181 RepID=A0ABQ7CAY7_BRACR|nr:hypothetical protein DY000_02007628 [Brassica cretica]
MPNSNLWAPNDQPLVLMESPGPGQPLYLNKDLDPGVVRDLVGILMFLRLDPEVAKSLTGLESAGVGVMTQVPGFALEKQDFDCSLYFTVLLQ